MSDRYLLSSLVVAHDKRLQMLTIKSNLNLSHGLACEHELASFFSLPQRTLSKTITKLLNKLLIIYYVIEHIYSKKSTFKEYKLSV